jgi:hypothetical protein
MELLTGILSNGRQFDILWLIVDDSFGMGLLTRSLNNGR